MTNEPAKTSRHNKFQLTIGVGTACLISGALISFTIIGLPLGIPLVLAGLVLIGLSPVVKVKQHLRSSRNDANQL